MNKISLAVAALVVMLALPFSAQAGEDAASLPEKELALVEKLVQSRLDYEDLLRELGEFYSATGNVHKKKLVQKELDSLVRMDKYDYIVPTIDLTAAPTEYIPAAETLFKDGTTYFEYFDLFEKKQKLNMALARFREILKKYPTSDKADDAAFYIGEIYASGHFKDYETAVKFYQLCYTLNPLTNRPARIKALDIYYKKLKDYGRAEALADKMLDSHMSAEIKKANQVLRLMAKRGQISSEHAESEEPAAEQPVETSAE